ncbi:Hypothetical protein R9X50_00562900 [Acrodontium crateriforme]|uniref:DAGKc domain-containing protein n=1 Tax=Acrodontium crateriforme TaxID=150365 RepID=A0AAQ3RB12_9PEZI|nr:Hypothetical protein R9X50_00562900 [Acrodontium crateriforme]
MGQEAIAPSHLEETITYERSGEGVVSWPNRIGTESETGYEKIPFPNIVAVVPALSAPRGHSILYVEDNPASKDDKSLAPVVFRSLAGSRPPARLVDDLPPVDVSFWSAWRATRTSETNLHIVVSTGSGTGQARDVWNRLLKPLLDFLQMEEKTDYVVHFTKSDSTVTELTNEILLPRANLGIAQAVVLLAGDGGMVDVINTLLSAERSPSYQKPNVIVMPLGTGNALAHSSGVTADNTMGLRSLILGTAKELPVFTASFSPGARYLVDESRQERPLHEHNGTPTAYGAVVCSWGLHAALVSDSDTAEYRKFGVERFKMAAKEALFPSDGSPCHEYKGRVLVARTQSELQTGKWELIERDSHGYILATFCRYLEKGFTISPQSQPLDSQLRMVHFGHVSGQDAVDIMGKAYKGGKHVEDARVGYEAIEGLRIEFEEDDGRWRRVCVDGKTVRVEQGGWVEIRSGGGSVLDVITT